MPENGSTLAQRVVTAMLAKDRATPMLGMVVLSAEEGACCLEMAVREDMLNGYETCHGGILFALADSAFAFACNSRNQSTVAAGAQIDFLRPARIGDVLRATAVELSAGKRLGLYDVTVTNQKQQTVALFRGKSCRVDGILVDDANTESATV
jgi:acyl-CoA thioesterase